MAQKATIFIPDISGYTKFLTSTEITHASHIINELLEIIVTENNQLFEIGEIEGDAVLMYKSGDPPKISELNQHCLKIFRAFHQYLKIIERDRLCNCGACTTASNLDLKFVAHYGDITTINVGGFSKASGLDMIVAHRLMKNSIDGHGYIMYSQSLLDAAEKGDGWDQGLEWAANSDTYDEIGEIRYSYSKLESIKESISTPEANPGFDPNYLEDIIEVEISSSLNDVYHKLLDPRTKKDWIGGMKEVRPGANIERVNSTHICVLEGFTAEVTSLGGESNEQEITLIDKALISEMDMEMFNYYKLSSRGENETHLICQLGAVKGHEFSQDIAKMMVENRQADLLRFKEFCEQGD